MNIKKPDFKNLNLKKPDVHLPRRQKKESEAGEQEVKRPASRKKRQGDSDKITVTEKKTRKRVVMSPAGEEELPDSRQEEAPKSDRRKRYSLGYERNADKEKRLSEERAAASEEKGGKGERDLTSKSHSAQRKDKEKQKLRKERKAAREKEAMKMRLILGGVVAAVLIILILVLTLGHKSKTRPETVKAESETAEEVPTSNLVKAGDIPHLSFRVLLSDYMAGDNSVLTISQFQQVLQRLYDENYILVDFYSIANQELNENGLKVYTETELDLPVGKKPFILSERDISYSLDRIGKGYASRLVVDENGKLVNEYQNLDGSIMVGSYDIVPILEDFIQEHPDFSFQGARGVLGLTGYNGILGYRTSELLGRSYEEGNPYAVYGTFDVNAEIEAAKPVVDALKKSGWHLASYGYNYTSYGAEQAMMTQDVDNWMTNVSTLIGGSDILIFPCETDIGYWSEYTLDNPKYQYLKNKGFSYFCIEEKNNPSWMQLRDEYVRQGIKEIDCWEDFEEVMQQAAE